MQPSLGMRYRGDAHAGTPDGKTERLELLDHRLDIFLVRRQEFNVVAYRKTEKSVRESVGNFTKPAQHIYSILAGCACAHGVNGIAAFGNMLQYARPRDFMIFPLSIVISDHRMQRLFISMRAGLYGFPLFCRSAHTISFLLM